MKHKAILLFGPPGSGKGTQGKALGILPGYRHVATGDLFRALDPQGALAQEVRSYSSRGALAPDDLAVRVWEDNVNHWIAKKQYITGEDVLILDGIPRNLRQAELLHEKIHVLKIVELVISDPEIIVARLKNRACTQGREDDADETIIRNRLQVYQDETAAALKYYPSNLIVQVNGNQSVMTVLSNIAASIAQD